MTAFRDEASSADSIFDLTAVVNHVGTLSTGHYYTTAKHQGTGQWHEFNDSSCSIRSEADLVTSAAYLLVYQKREAGHDFEDK